MIVFRKAMMILVSFILLINLSGCNSVKTMASSYEHLFKDGEIIDIKIEIPEEDWEDIKENAIDEEYHMANLTINNINVEDIGIRTKGNSSLRSVAGSDSDRYSFRIKIDKYIDDQTVEGMDEFVLNSQFADPSYLREYLTYKAMAELGGTTPYVNFCNLYINDELFGFYLCIEALDDSFVERLTDAEDTNLYKADGERATLLSDMDLKQFENKYGEDEELQNIQKLIDIINNEDVTKEELENIIDVDSVLKAMAINSIMGNYDSYSGSMAHNYYLLYENGKFEYIGWDYNMSIGGFMENGASVKADISNPVYGTTLEKRPLFETIFAIEDYQNTY